MVEKKPRPRIGATFAECPKCHDQVNANWISDGSCCYCKMADHHGGET